MCFIYQVDSQILLHSAAFIKISLLPRQVQLQLASVYRSVCESVLSVRGAEKTCTVDEDIYLY